MPTQVKSVEVTLDEDKETKRTIRFASDDEDAAISQLYLSKEAVAELGNPHRITVTIEAA